MKSKHLTLFLILASIILIGIGKVEAAACQYNNLFSGCNIDANLQLNNSQTFYVFNATNAIILGETTGNFVLDCNGSTIIGNGSGTGLYSGFRNNITIQIKSKKEAI